MPVLLDTSILFYTDLLALTTVLAGFSLENPVTSCIFFIIAVLTRQTNIVWAGSYCLLKWLKSFDRNKPISSTINFIVKHLG